ncbi:helix-turn-helix domain-containing protein [Nonomuraea sp. SBT364]|uniref:helix-turn-helix domain-containing protein n=1 Tax=Nonomuraea sp. SBT364 TaxID=1580530 RepID=UPI003FA54044
MRALGGVREYAGGIRYPDGGSLTPAARAEREEVRLEIAGLFAAGMSPPQVAKKLRVFRKSAYVWHRAWRTAGVEALASKGRVGSAAGSAQRRCSAWRPRWTAVRPCGA